MLRATVAETTELLDRLDSEIGIATGRERRLDQGRQSQQPDRVEISEPTNTRGALAAPPVALDTAQPVPDHTASAVSQATGVAEPPVSSERQWIRGTIREISRTEAGATIWVVPEDQPRSVVSILFTNEEVGPEAVAYVCASFEAGESVRVWHIDRLGHNIEQI